MTEQDQANPPNDVSAPRKPTLEYIKGYRTQAVVGMLLILLGLALCVAGLMFDATVTTPSAPQVLYGGLTLPSYPEEVVNLGKLGDKIILFISGGILLLAGMILRGTAVILDWVHESTVRHRYQMGDLISRK